MSLALGAAAGGFSAASVGEGEGAGQGVGGNLEAAQHGVLALTQASGRIAFGIVPFHLGVIIHPDLLPMSTWNVLANLRNLIPPTSSVSTQGYKPGAEVLTGTTGTTGTTGRYAT